MTMFLRISQQYQFWIIYWSLCYSLKLVSLTGNARKCKKKASYETLKLERLRYTPDNLCGKVCFDFPMHFQKFQHKILTELCRIEQGQDIARNQENNIWQNDGYVCFKYFASLFSKILDQNFYVSCFLVTQPSWIE